MVASCCAAILRILRRCKSSSTQNRATCFPLFHERFCLLNGYFDIGIRLTRHDRRHDRSVPLRLSIRRNSPSCYLRLHAQGACKKKTSQHKTDRPPSVFFHRDNACTYFTFCLIYHAIAAADTALRCPARFSPAFWPAREFATPARPCSVHTPCLIAAQIKTKHLLPFRSACLFRNQ